MKLLLLKDTVAGILIILMGIFFAVGASNYGIGTPTHMGPGFFPGALGIIAIVLGLGILLKGLRTSEIMPTPHYRPLLAVLAGIGAFALLVERAGLIPATFAAVMIFSLGNPNRGRLWPILVLAVCICVAVWLIFILGLAVPVPAIRGLL